jgi:hypothetical protein
VPCIESIRTDGAMARRSGVHALLVATVVLALAACSQSERAPGEASGPTTRSAPAAATAQSSNVATAAAAAGTEPIVRRPLPAPTARRNWNEVRRQAAERLVAANPDITYTGKVPDQLLAIPVVEVELNGDGSVRRIEILREPREAKDTMKIAVEAIRRAAPFGDVSRLPKPWKFVETFLFDDARKFKPRTLDN